MHAIDLGGLSRSFGFATPPRVPLNLKTSGAKVRKRGGGGGFGDKDRKSVHDKIRAQGSGHAFSAANPYGKRGGDDGRQFQH